MESRATEQTVFVSEWATRVRESGRERTLDNDANDLSLYLH